MKQVTWRRIVIFNDRNSWIVRKRNFQSWFLVSNLCHFISFFLFIVDHKREGSNRAKGQTKDLVGKMMLTCGIPASIALRVERKVRKMNQLADCSGPCRLFIAYEVLWQSGNTDLPLNARGAVIRCDYCPLVCLVENYQATCCLLLLLRWLVKRAQQLPIINKLSSRFWILWGNEIFETWDTKLGNELWARCTGSGPPKAGGWLQGY